MPQRAVRPTEIVIDEVERQCFHGQPLALLTDGEVTSLYERRGDAGQASILAEYLPPLHLDQTPVPIMLDDLGISEVLIRD